jgi:hypothetical protein
MVVLSEACPIPVGFKIFMFRFPTSNHGVVWLQKWFSMPLSSINESNFSISKDENRIIIYSFLFIIQGK